MKDPSPITFRQLVLYLVIRPDNLGRAKTTPHQCSHKRLNRPSELE